MSRLQFVVDGKAVFDHEVEHWMLPPEPQLIEPSMRAQMNPNAVPPPWLKAFMIASIGNALANQVLTRPQLQPLEIGLTTRPTGWTLSVDLPAPAEHTDIEVMTVDGDRS
jgi:hypothetical protein